MPAESMATLIRRMDWSSTPLGPAEQWPETLRSTLGLCLDSAFPIAIYWGPQLALLYNDAWRPILGDKHPAALGQAATDVWPEIWDAIEPVFRHVRETRLGVFNGDSMLAMHRYGYVEECYFDYTFNPIRDGRGGVAGIFNVVIETTYRVINERRGKVQRDFAARIAAARDVEGVLHLAAQALEAAPFDVPFALLFRPGSAGAPARLANAVRAASGLARDPEAWPLGDAMACGVPVRVDDVPGRIGTRSGGAWPETPRQALVLPVMAPGRATCDALLVVGASPRRALDDDYTEFFEALARHMAAAIASAEAFEAERRRAEALAELDHAKTAFFGNVSHELRTPLTLVLGPLDDVLAPGANGVTADARALLHVARRNGRRLLKLVNTLLEFSRIEAGWLKARYEPTDLARLTRDLASNFRSACEGAELTLRVECEPLAEPVFVDHDMWERIVLNLLSNAFKFTLRGEICVALTEFDGRAILTIRDTGAGIPADELPRLFERFHRVEGTRGRSHEGTGIGLALVHELVRLHGGEIKVDSAVDQGSTFAVSLPLGRAHLPSEQVLAESSTVEVTHAAPFVEEALSWLGTCTEVEADESDPRATARGTRRRVLVADDNADMRGYMARLLGRAYDVVLATNGEQALELARRVSPDLVLSDVMMPGLDGFALLQALRADERTRQTPFIMISARAGEEARLEGLQAGADDYLVKPFGGRELVARLSSALQLAAQRQEADRRKDEFLATLAHELRNPLAPLRMAAELLKYAPDASAQQAAREVIDRQVGSMAHLIDDLMDVSRISRGKVELRKELVDVKAVINDAVEAAQSLIDEAEQSLSVTLPARSIPVHGDPVRLTQIFTNLLNNASKYSDSGARIDVEARIVGDTVIVAVRDQGIGIEPEMLGTIWDMFVQTNRSIERSRGGLGIGLTLVRTLVGLHGGAVEAASAGPGRGATFTVSLPLDVLSQARRSLSAPRIEGLPAPMRVLVADDNKDAAEMLGMYLQTTGCEVVTAYDGSAALELAAQFRPDVALLDLGMPRLDGLAVARRLREEPWGRSIRLVALTGWGQEQDRKRSSEAGFDHHLVKPVAGDVVAALLARLAPRSNGANSV